VALAYAAGSSLGLDGSLFSDSYASGGIIMGYSTTNIHGAKRVTVVVTHYPTNADRPEFWDATFSVYDESDLIASFTVFFNEKPVDLIASHGLHNVSYLFGSKK
jgi:hypothetical protein